MMKKIGILAGIGAALVAVLVLAGSAFAQDGGVSVSDGSGDGGTVTLDVTDVGGNGLGAWTVDISYDSDVITASGCTAEQGGVCNEGYTDTSVRITGASAGGLDGDTTLGSITFDCIDDSGSSDLTLDISVFADATIGDPQDLSPSVSGGTFSCDAEVATATTEVVEPPIVGTGVASDGSGFSWLIALIAVIGLGVLATGYGVARSRA